MIFSLRANYISVHVLCLRNLCIIVCVFIRLWVWKDREGAQCGLGKHGVRREIPFVFEVLACLFL